MKTKTELIKELYNKNNSYKDIQEILKNQNIDLSIHYIRNIINRLKTNNKLIKEQEQEQKQESNNKEQEQKQESNNKITIINKNIDIKQFIPQNPLIYYERKLSNNTTDYKLLDEYYKYNCNIKDENDKYINLLIEGETATAKTLFIKYYCYKNQIPYFCFNVNNQTNNNDLLGNFVNVNQFILGFLPMFIQHKGIFVIDEMNTAQQDILVLLNNLLNNREIVINEINTTIKAHKEFMLIATQNPLNYEGRKNLSEDFLRRFRKIIFNYDIETEKHLIKDKKLIPFIEKLRFMYFNKEINKPIPITLFINFETDKQIFKNDEIALLNLLNNFNDEEQTAIKNLYNDFFNVNNNKFKKNDLKKDIELNEINNIK
jgi:DNA-binding transcriptional MerR regulator